MTPSDTLENAGARAPAIAPAEISAVQRFYWSLRRELWESRSLYLAPLAVACLILLGGLISAVRLPWRLRAAASLGPVRLHEVITQPYHFAEFVLMATTLVVAIFYCLDALQGERRDRSILFWKSLPVSDLMTVLAKACIPIAMLPLLTFVVTVITQGIMLLMGSAALAASGQDAGLPWQHVPFLQTSSLILYHLVTVHGLRYAPMFAWLLLASAWARRGAFLWAGLPPLAIVVVERIAFGSSRFGTMLGNMLAGGPAGEAFMKADASMHPMAGLAPGHFLASPALWIGLALAALFLAGAVVLRRRRGPA